MTASENRSRTASETLIRRLHEIDADRSHGFDHQMELLLLLGCQRFDLEIGVLSRVNGDRYEVLHVTAPYTSGLRPGATFHLSETYCGQTLAADGPLGFGQVAGSEMQDHPAYRALRLEAYVGAPVRVDGEIFGTLGFSSPVPRRRDFDAADVDALELMASWISGELHRLRLEADLRDAMTRLQDLARVDHLTELLNRRGMDDTLERMAARIRCGALPCTAVLVDLDDRGRNDPERGTAAADEVLGLVANRIRNAVRPLDVVARVADDEFLVLLADCPAAHATPLAERIRHAVCDRPVETERGPVPIRARIGIAETDAETSTVNDVLATVTGAIEPGTRGAQEPASSGSDF